MIWTTHNCFSRLVAGYRGKYVLLFLCLSCCMAFGAVNITNFKFDYVFTRSQSLSVLVLSFRDVHAGDSIVFGNSGNFKISDIVIDDDFVVSRIGVNYLFYANNTLLRTLGSSVRYYPDGRIFYDVSNDVVVFNDDYDEVKLYVYASDWFPKGVISYRYTCDIPITTNSSSLMPSYNPVLGMADGQYYDDLTSNFVSIGAVLLAVPLAIFFIYKGWSFVRGGLIAIMLLSSVLVFGRGDTNPNPVPTGYIENTDGSTAFYADYVTNQQFADFAGVQTTETYDFNNPYADVDVSQITSNDVSGIQADFSSVAGAGEAQLQLQHMQQDFNNARYQGLYNSTPIMLMPAAFSSSAGGVVGDTIFSAPPVWQIFSTFDTNSFGYFSVQSAFNLLLNCLGFFIAISVMIFLVRSFTSH